MKQILLCSLLAVTCGSFIQGFAHADDGRRVGEVSTVFKFLTPNDKIKVNAFEDPQIGGVTCFISRAVTGGLKGVFGVAEDTSDASISCHQTGAIRFHDGIEGGAKGEEVFNERRSLLFKELHVTRYYDAASNTLVYLTWSDRVIEGSPKNSISAVTLMAWDGVAPQAPRLD